jgi:hypothetical protein
MAPYCPHCGRPLRKAKKTPRQFGCCGLIAFGLLGLFVYALSTATNRNPAPVASTSPRLQVGADAVLDLPGATGVWLATNDEDFDAMIDAENAAAKGGPGAGAAIYRLAESGRARKYPVGTRVVVQKLGLFSAFVEVIEGPDRGRSGWVQIEIVRPYVPPKVQEPPKAEQHATGGELLSTPPPVAPEPAATPRPSRSEGGLRPGHCASIIDSRLPVAMTLGQFRDFRSDPTIDLVSQGGFRLDPGTFVEVLTLDGAAAEIHVLSGQSQAGRNGWMAIQNLKLEIKSVKDIEGPLIRKAAAKAEVVAAKEKAENEAKENDRRLAQQQKRAEVLWRTAENLERQRKPSGAATFYKQLIRECPDSTLAVKAMERVKALGAN